ncbi:DgyrCDS12934 [Dimorphilus gyrociliatus]|uniref:Medium-chain acyl-CoA ligase ACSF2, mitochondrial n=1 Tax=Dimorphilus gyrociliatus TaxID=2664684 RepID=A0A7I8W961_9ANNE|nr:DgyrCDS12934 [Dimorphilus gyrociliatus]
MNQYAYRETFKNILKCNNSRNRLVFKGLLFGEKTPISVFSSCSFSTRQEKDGFSYSHGSSTKRLLGKTIGQLLEERAEMHPDKEAVIVSKENARLTFEQLLQQADRLAMGLISIGVRKGDRVGIWSPNKKEWVLAQYATARAGMMLVNINPAYQVGELQYAMQKVGIKALISAEQFKTQDYFSMLEKVCPELNNCKPGNIKNQSLPEFQSLIMISDKQYPGSFTFSEIMDAGDQSHKGILDQIKSTLQFDEPINIQFTSGTTGSPKGATLSHHNIVNNSNLVGYRCGYDVNPARIVIPVPLYHCFGMVLGSLMNVTHGATTILPSPSFEPKAALEAVVKEKATSLYGTPTMFIDMQNHPDFGKYDLSSLYTGIMAGSTCPTEIMKKCISKMCMKNITVSCLTIVCLFL